MGQFSKNGKKMTESVVNEKGQRSRLGHCQDVEIEGWNEHKSFERSAEKREERLKKETRRLKEMK